MVEVTTLIQEHKERFAPYEPLVRELEALLEEAKTGRLRAVAVALVRHDSLVADGETSPFIISAPGTYHAVSHAIQGLVRRWGRYCDDELTRFDGRI